MIVSEPLEARYWGIVDLRAGVSPRRIDPDSPSYVVRSWVNDLRVCVHLGVGD